MTNHRIKSERETDREKLEQKVELSDSWTAKLNEGTPVDAGGAPANVVLVEGDWLTIGVRRDPDTGPPLTDFTAHITAPDGTSHALTEAGNAEGQLVTLTARSATGGTESRKIKVKVVMENDMPDTW